MNYIGENLKYLLKQESISENELSRRLGIAQQIINRIISGSNQNPKIATLMPIANYFNIPLHNFIENQLADSKNKAEATHIHRIPYIEFREIKNLGVEEAILLTKKYISVDINNKTDYFATSMYDDSMEPKFSKGTILVFEKTGEAISGDFCLLKGDNSHYMFRQVLINSMDKKFIKCLNPTGEDFSALPLPVNFYVLATLLESRTIFSS
ncbi:helix-turn-helix domain-containing protein [Legionella fairfieldensis]|uniref:helix-turn-helix domain-containing protein n=1 Tax=Legionella fairfieldensis TaxID=45064 RepID=UPI00048D258A|nr:helix-turn-helix domain-containing protein [Legionella fairfieldensis]